MGGYKTSIKQEVICVISVPTTYVHISAYKTYWCVYCMC